MFTGIIEEVGKINKKDKYFLEITGEIILNGVSEGDSVSVNGACLTITKLMGTSFAVDLSSETLNRTNLGDLMKNDPVNLERASTLNKMIGGHLVQGHIDGIGEIELLKGIGDSSLLTIRTDSKILKYVVEKGFIAIDGISFTVSNIFKDSFTISVIPYTKDKTNILYKHQGDHVNIEVDIIGKYVEKLLTFYQH